MAVYVYIVHGRMQGKGPNSFTSGIEGPWTSDPTTWDSRWHSLTGAVRQQATVTPRSTVLPQRASATATTAALFGGVTVEYVVFAYFFYYFAASAVVLNIIA